MIKSRKNQSRLRFIWSYGGLSTPVRISNEMSFNEMSHSVPLVSWNSLAYLPGLSAFLLLLIPSRTFNRSAVSIDVRFTPDMWVLTSLDAPPPPPSTLRSLQNEAPHCIHYFSRSHTTSLIVFCSILVIYIRVRPAMIDCIDTTLLSSVNLDASKAVDMVGTWCVLLFLVPLRIHEIQLVICSGWVFHTHSWRRCTFEPQCGRARRSVWCELPEMSPSNPQRLLQDVFVHRHCRCPLAETQIND